MYLVALADAEPRPHDLLASPDARGLVASALDAVERAVEAAAGIGEAAA